MGDNKQDVKDSVKVFTQTFVSYVVKESTKKLIKGLTQTQKKMLETKVKHLSDDQLEEYFDKDPYFKKELENTVKSVNNTPPSESSGSWLENLQTVCESSCIQNLIKVLIQQVTRTAILIIAGAALLAMIAAPAVLPDDDIQFSLANFSSNITEGYAPLSVEFTASSQNATGWKWNFGDGNNSTEQNPVHTYFVAGIYNVSLEATDGKESDFVNTTITVLNDTLSVLPVANFSSNVTTGYVPLSVQFSDSSENATEWNWNFGDGNNSSEQSPAHTYSAVGNYTVSLTVTNTNGTDSKLSKITVFSVEYFMGSSMSSGIENIPTNLENLSRLALPVADFSSNVTSGNAPLIVLFTDTSKGTPTAWNWDFGDGTTSIEQSPVHTFSAEGTYNVNLKVSNLNGTNSKTATINVSPGVVTLPGPVAFFSSNVTRGYAPLSVQFTDQSRNATGWNWNFGDGSGSTGQNPVRTYYAAGNYTVNLTATNEIGIDSVSAIIVVLEPPVLPVASFSSNVTQGYVPLTVQFTDLSKNATGWDWDFGDGNSSTERNVTHTYYAAGNYTVKLTVSNEEGVSSTFAVIEVREIPEPLSKISSGLATDPAIYGDRIVWSDHRKNSDIYMYDLSTSTENQISTSGSAENPAIYGDKIVWHDYRNGNSDIYMYDLSNYTETQITTNELSQYSPAIYGDRIVWQDYRNGSSIYLYDLSTSTETQITADESYLYNPAIYGDRIVWEGYQEEGSIYLYDLSTSTETKITTKPYLDNPAIYGDRIVWEDYQDGYSRIYLYDLSTSTETQISTGRSAEDPAIYGDRIVWEDYQNGYSSIYLFDLSTSTETRIATNESYQLNPAIYGDRIVWIMTENIELEEGDIYMYDLSILQ